MFCSTFAETGFPFIFSIAKNINFPPSRAGIGNKLNIATKTEIAAIKYKKKPGPKLTAFAKNIVMPIGPAKAAPSGRPLPLNKSTKTVKSPCTAFMVISPV